MADIVPVEFWFDPACPFCWMTSRWIVEVAPRRGLDIEWRSISLLLKNEPSPDSPVFDTVTRTHAMLRVVESLRAAGHADRIGDVYTAFGTQVHHESTTEFDVAEVLSGLGLDPSHASALDDTGLDEAIRASMDVALDLAGDDVGTPIIGLDDLDGRRVGLFGPVITDHPEPDAGLRLWDGFVAVATTPGFHELKRSRTGPPGLPDLSRV